MSFIVRLVILAFVFLFASKIFAGITLSSYLTGIFVALSLLIANVIVRPILLLVSLPINIITFGLFTYIVNTVVLILVDKLYSGFSISSFWLAFLLAAVVNIVDNRFLKKKPYQVVINREVDQKNVIIDVDHEEVK